MSLEKEIEEFEELSESRSRAHSATSDKLSEIKEKIKNGESTGDKIRDYLIFIGVQLPNGKLADSEYGDLETNLRELSSRVHDNQGKQILLIRQNETISGCTGFGHPGFKAMDETYELGVIQGEIKFDLTRDIKIGIEDDVRIPTGKKAVKNSNPYHKEWKLKDGDVGFGILYFGSIGKNLEAGFGEADLGFSYSSAGKGLLYYLGDEVPLYFSIGDWHRESIISRIRKGEIKREDLATERFDIVNSVDTSYVDALNLLGLEVPGNFQQVYSAERYKEKVGVVKSLRALVSSEEGLVRRIRQIQSVPASGGTLYEGGAVTVIEDQDDAFWVTVGERKEVRNVRGDITRTLQKAVTFGMNKNPWILDIGEKGEHVDVPRYVNGLIDKYELLVK